MVLNRKCPVCSGIYKADTQRLKYGRQTTCSRTCSYKLRAEKLKKPEEEKFDTQAYNKAYYQQHAERIKKHVRDYVLKTGYKYKLTEEQKSRSNDRAKQWYRDNKETVILRSKKWKANNKDKVNAGSRDYASRRRGAVGSYSVKDFLKLKRIHCGICAYCNNCEANSIDHVIPLSKGGTNYIGNILPVCSTCNSSKGAKTIVSWRHANGRL